MAGIVATSCHSLDGNVFSISLFTVISNVVLDKILNLILTLCFRILFRPIQY